MGAPPPPPRLKSLITLNVPYSNLHDILIANIYYYHAIFYKLLWKKLGVDHYKGYNMANGLQKIWVSQTFSRISQVFEQLSPSRSLNFFKDYK